MIKSGIYIHIPYCRAKCVYCDIYSVASQEDLVPRFVNGLIREINDFVGEIDDYQFDTLFLGGGTPSLLTPDQLSEILAALDSRFGTLNWLEATIEANPGTVALEKLKAYHQLGINRISLGVQSFNPQNLTFLSRIHSAKESRTANEHARAAGFDNLSCDLIFGLPGQTWTHWQQDLAAVVELGPKHLSCYNLTVEEQTPLYDLTSAGKIRMPNDETTADLFKRTGDYLAEQGYPRYEISNYARSGFECRHNLHYWRIEPYLGFGPSAHSFDGTRRWWNVNNLNQYLTRVKSGSSAVHETELLTPVELINERIGFGLRIAEGFNLDDIPVKYRFQVENQIEICHKKWPSCLASSGNRQSLTSKGLLFADAIAVDMQLGI